VFSFAKLTAKFSIVNDSAKIKDCQHKQESPYKFTRKWKCLHKDEISTVVPRPWIQTVSITYSKIKIIYKLILDKHKQIIRVNCHFMLKHVKVHVKRKMKVCGDCVGRDKTRWLRQVTYKPAGDGLLMINLLFSGPWWLKNSAWKNPQKYIGGTDYWSLHLCLSWLIS